MSGKLPCEDFAKTCIPALRSVIAKKLYQEHHLSQVTIAEKMGTTQAAVSQYISSKRGKTIKQELADTPGLDETINRITEKIAEGKEPVIFSQEICNLCNELKMKNI